MIERPRLRRAASEAPGAADRARRGRNDVAPVAGLGDPGRAFSETDLHLRHAYALVAELRRAISSGPSDRR
jgi:hypothetical protein